MAEMTISDYASIKELENEHREFAQTQTYNLASQGVTVTERCRN